MPCVMEVFFGVWVTRMLQPLYVPVQPYKVTAFVWTQAHWGDVAHQLNSAAQTRYAAKQAEKVEQQRQAAVDARLSQQQEDADIGTFDL